MDMRWSSAEGAGRRLHRSLVTVAALVVVAVATAGTASAGGTDGRLEAFGDVAPQTFYEQPVAWMAAEGITTGIEPGCFGPDLPVTRAQVAAFLYRLDAATGHSPVVPASLPFDDVTAGWARGPVAWLAAEHITTGKAPGRFDPDAPVTRGEFAAFLWRYARHLGLDVSTGGELPFDDVVRTWQIEPVAWLAEHGITTGKAPGRFDPEAPVTRGEAATFLWRFVGRPAATSAAGDPGSCLRPLRETLVTFGLTPTEAACVAPHLAGFDPDELLAVIEHRQVPSAEVLDALAAASTCLSVERIHQLVEIFF